VTSGGPTTGARWRFRACSPDRRLYG
jgi:hypothetical protein